MEDLEGFVNGLDAREIIDLEILIAKRKREIIAASTSAVSVYLIGYDRNRKIAAIAALRGSNIGFRYGLADAKRMFDSIDAGKTRIRLTSDATTADATQLYKLLSTAGGVIDIVPNG